MLSRFYFSGGQNFKKCVLKLQPVSAITTSAVTASEKIAKTGSAAPAEYPPPSSKRDFVNFPPLRMRERPPPVRLGFIPDSWFQFFYPKTGYTGPYVFLFSLGTYMYSKEIIVYDHNLVHLYSFLTLMIFLNFKFGDKFGELYEKILQKAIQDLDGDQEREKESVRKNIQDLEKLGTMKTAVLEVTKARTEFINLQMEAAFRERLVEAYKKIKSRLDCQLELDNVEKRVVQKNLVDYVIRNVMKSITPDLEKNVLQSCIKDLNDLSARA